MASLISQMRNGQQPQSQQLTDQQLNQSIEQVREMMQQIRNAPDSQAMLVQILQNNPNTAMIAAMLQNGNGLEGVAKAMAINRGVNINNLINRLQGGF